MGLIRHRITGFGDMSRLIQPVTVNEMCELDDKLCDAYLWMWDSPFAKAQHFKLRAFMKRRTKALAPVIKLGECR